MRDPEPANITGQKVQRHVFKHEINWGYVAIAVVAFLALVQFGDLLEGKNQEDGVGTKR